MTLISLFFEDALFAQKTTLSILTFSSLVQIKTKIISKTNKSLKSIFLLSVIFCVAW